MASIHLMNMRHAVLARTMYTNGLKGPGATVTGRTFILRVYSNLAAKKLASHQSCEGQPTPQITA